MKAIYFQTAGALALSFGLGALAACAPTPPPPAAASPPVVVAPTPTPAPAPPAVVQEPVYVNFLDAPQTPGSWTYLLEPEETLALYGQTSEEPVFIVRCSQGHVGLARKTASGSTATRAMSVHTETTTRQLQASKIADRPLVAAIMPARDPLLDAMAITKGRFAVQVEGERTLYLPSWAEVTRVIEDCR